MLEAADEDDFSVQLDPSGLVECSSLTGEDAVLFEYLSDSELENPLQLCRDQGFWLFAMEAVAGRWGNIDDFDAAEVIQLIPADDGGW